MQAVGTELRKRGAPNMLVGGMATSAHSGPQTTEDVDLVVFVSPQQAHLLVASVESAGLAVERRAEAIRRLRLLKPVKVGTSGRYHVDLRIASWGIDIDAMRRATQSVAGGVTLVPREELVAYKLARYTDRDRDHIKAVIGARPGFDWERAARATAKLADELGRPVMLDRLHAMAARFGR